MRLKLAKMLQAFGEQNTDNGILMYEGELAIDVEVFIQDEAGEVVPAPDGEYKSEDGKVIVVSGGKVTELKEAEKPAEEEAPVEQADEPIEESPKEEPQPDKVAELEAIIAEKDAEIEKLKAEIEAMKAENTELKMSSDAKPAATEIKDIKLGSEKENKALKFFK